MAAVSYYSDFCGDPPQDAIKLVLRKPGKRDEIHIYSAYEVKCGILQQPSSFTFHVGWGNELIQLLEIFNAVPQSDPTNLKPFPEFELHVYDTCIMTGNIEAVNMPTLAQTKLEIKGRGKLSALLKSSILDEVTLQSQTYDALVKEVLSKVGLGDSTLSFSNEANRNLITRTKFRKRRARTDVNKQQLVATIDTGIQAPGGGKIQLQHLLARVGEDWYHWLEKQLILAGLILWETGDGNFVLGSPTLDQEAFYRVIHQKDQTRDEVNIVDCHLNNDFTSQHTTVTAYGRYGSTGGGRSRCEGTAINVDMYAHTGGQGIYPLVIEDDDVKNNQQAFYRANRAMSEECRAGFGLQYTFSGHRMPAAARGYEDQMVVWAPDTITDVQDDWLGFHELMYNESVTFRCNPQTTTVVDMIRPRYLAYYASTPPPP